MAALYPFSCIVTLLVWSTLLAPSHSSRSINHNTNNNDGFSFSVIHRDSPKSPFYNHSMTIYERNMEAARRSINRQHYHHQRLSAIAEPESTTGPPADISMKLESDRSEYLTDILIGTPQTQITIALDTGSELSWIKSAPVFDSSKSSSYRKRSCSKDKCPPLTTCNTKDDTCQFNVIYADGSFSSGIISYEEFVFDDKDGKGGKVNVINLMFGYSTANLNFDAPVDGLFGLNMHSQSFIAQLGITRFSHCFAPYDLGPHDNDGKMYFGPSAKMGNSVTPIEKRNTNYYFVTLDAVSIGEKNVDMPSGVFEMGNDGKGGVMVDTGTTYTQFVPEAYEAFKNEFKERINRTMVEGIGLFDLCYSGSLDNLGEFPDMTFRFANDVAVRLVKESVYAEFQQGVICVAVHPAQSDSAFNVIGNYHMRNLLVGYDLLKMQISFDTANCSDL